MKYLLSTPYNCAQAAKTELKRLWYLRSKVTSPTTVEFEADEEAIARVNVRSRIANKLYLTAWVLGARDRDQLYEWVKWARWSHRLSPWQAVRVQAQTHSSQLTSTPTIQSISQKAIYDAMTDGGEYAIDENFVPVEIMISIFRDQVTIMLNSSGESLHRRGYRLEAWLAPLKENLAAALILDSGWNFAETLYDVCCGSGTIAIEAWLIAKNIAPWLHRDFAFESRGWYDPKYYAQTLKSAYEAQMRDKPHTIIASDIDPEMITIAQANADRAWLIDTITFVTKDCHEYLDQTMFGTMVSNPPYGQRLQPLGLTQLYTTLTKLYQTNPDVNWGIITSYERHPHSKRSTKEFHNGSEEVVWFKKI